MKYAITRKQAFLAAVLLVIAGTTLRIAAVFTEFWLDEIWALRILQDANSWTDIFRIQLDNNHILNSLYLYAVRGGDGWHRYRLFALLCGCIALTVMARTTLSRDLASGVFCTFLLSFSYPLVLYSSEARGYGALIAAMAICFALFLRYAQKPSMRILFFFWAVSMLGCLAHFSFLHFYAALFGWSLLHLRGSTLVKAKRLGALHGLPLVFFAVIYFTFIRHVPPGSGTLMSYAEVLLDTASFSAGGPQLSPYQPELGAGVLLLVFVLLVITLRALYLLWRDRDDIWLFYLLAVFAVPLAILQLLQPRVLFVRYLLPAIFCWYLLMSDFLAHLVKRDRGGLVLAALAAFLFLAGNGLHLSALYTCGRGEYARAIRDIEGMSASSTVTAGSDQDFRNGTVLDYYKDVLKLEKSVRYVNQDSFAANPPEWYIGHSQDQAYVPPSELSPDGTNHYLLINSYCSAPLSGWRWFVYRRACAPDCLR